MIFKESSAVTYAIYNMTDEEITKENVYDYLELLDRNGFFYYKIVDTTMIKLVEEYREKVRNDEPIVLDMIRFNRIFKVVKDICRDRKLGI